MLAGIYVTMGESGARPSSPSGPSSRLEAATSDAARVKLGEMYYSGRYDEAPGSIREGRGVESRCGSRYALGQAYLRQAKPARRRSSSCRSS